MKQEQEIHNNKNIVPLGNDEIKSILKSQSETVFEDKNISSNSNFVKKSLIDIALDFKSKQNIKENEITGDKSENNNKQISLLDIDENQKSKNIDDVLEIPAFLRR